MTHPDASAAVKKALAQTDKDLGQPMLSVDDVSVNLDVSCRTVTRMCVSGDLPAAKIGGQWRIDRRDYLRWLKERKAKAWRQFTSVGTHGGSASSGRDKKSGGQLEQLLRARPENISRQFRSNTAS